MTDLAIFYHFPLPNNSSTILLEEDVSRHLIQVLRMNNGDKIILNDGQGNMAESIIEDADKRKTRVKIISNFFKPPSIPSIYMAIAFTKNAGRNEWMVEKLTELGITGIIPLQCKRSVKEKFRPERIQNILISAMNQSRQFHLPRLYEPLKPEDVFAQFGSGKQVVMAHCLESEPRRLLKDVLIPNRDLLFFIGPEGDFTPDEIELSLQNKALPVSLGSRRLRTETAALAACSFFNQLNAKNE